tara:strand:- start:360 stop:551 length:192 start_codon:yes stop_codon:yes gene_type:complete
MKRRTTMIKTFYVEFQDEWHTHIKASSKKEVLEIVQRDPIYNYSHDNPVCNILEENDDEETKG